MVAYSKTAEDASKARFFHVFMPEVGVEPTSPKARDLESRVSASSTTPALW